MALNRVRCCPEELGVSDSWPEDVELAPQSPGINVVENGPVSDEEQTVGNVDDAMPQPDLYIGMARVGQHRSHTFGKSTFLWQ